MNFRELFEGMNQNRQKGMLSKDHLEKYLASGEHIQIGDDTLWLDSDKKWMINTKESKFTAVYQMYRAAFKNGNITEKVVPGSIEDLENEIEELKMELKGKDRSESALYKTQIFKLQKQLKKLKKV